MLARGASGDKHERPAVYLLEIAMAFGFQTGTLLAQADKVNECRTEICRPQGRAL